MSAQRQYDVGVYAGASYYMGEINPAKQLYKPRQNLGALYRYIFNNRYAVKAQINRARIVADDLSSNSEFQIERAESFKYNIWDFSIQAEFNFLEYNTTDMKNRYSPYVTTGISGIVFPVNLKLPIALPLGIGFKYNYDKRIGVGIEWTFKRTFDDDWDFNNERTINNHQTAFQYNKDWYSFVGLFLTYKFDESFECPAYD
jgi:uncharacterized protein DUF6089